MKKLNISFPFFIKKSSSKKYLLLLFVFVVLVATFLFSGSVFSEYYEQFFVDTPEINITLKQLENQDTAFTVYFNPAHIPDTKEEGDGNLYSINAGYDCSNYVYNEETYKNECVDPILDLCPYIAVTPNNEEDTEVGFVRSSSPWHRATGQLSNPTDMTDNWTLSIKSPCFEGECPEDYNILQNGLPLAQSLKGKTFKCNLFVDSNEIPVLMMNPLLPKIAYADYSLNTISVSAVFTGETEGCTVDCNSSVLFLPGVMGSRLYDQTGKELWVSSSDSSHKKLILNNQGKSIDDVYTKNDTQRLDGDTDETGIVDDVYSFNIYQSFINNLKQWKEDEKIIQDYAFIPYDWRLSLDDIINNGKVTTGDNLSYSQTQDFSESFILKKLEELQKDSRSGKVTVVAHSNGGLVAKALIQKLKDTNNPLYEKIDKVILVAVPQVGTPEAFINLLHGTNIGPAGLVMSNERSRQLADNMPAVYNLLPSLKYFTTVDPAFAVDKIASFENKPFFDSQTSQYGVFISNENEMKSYILGGDGRVDPDFNDTVHPNIGNTTLYDQAQNVHQILDDWSPYQDTKIIQVAGWGEETLSGLEYKSYFNFLGSEYLSFKPKQVIDGDGTVVVPSALWMSDSNPNVERWWVDLLNYKRKNYGRTHKDILEVSNLLDFIKTKITDSVFTDPDNIIVNNTTTLNSSNISRLHYTLHSPLTLGVTDTQGKYTGMDPVTRQIKEEIPNVRYLKIGDVQFISIPDDIAHTVKMQGYEEGSFSIDIEKQEGNEILESSSLQGIPSSTSTTATIQVASNSSIEDSILSIDQNGDGIVDQTLQVKEGEVVVYDTTPPELQLTFDLNSKKVIMSGEDNVDIDPILNIAKKSITIKDKSDNTTIIPFTKYRKGKNEFEIFFKEIIRNSIKTKIPEIQIKYSWKEKRGLITDLDTNIIIKDGKQYNFSYNKGKNITIISEKEYLYKRKYNNHKEDNSNKGYGNHKEDDHYDKNWKIIKKVKGFVPVTITTEGDDIKVDY